MTDSDDNIYYDDEAISDCYNSDDDEDDCLDESEGSPKRINNKRNYTVLSEDDIRQHQADNIDTLSSILSIPKQDASVLLRHYHWNREKVEVAWFSDEEKVRKSVGLFLNELVTKYPNSQVIKCRICYDEKRANNFTSTEYCGHVFCIKCWKQYICTSIDDGPGCLTLRCPDPKCRGVVSQDMIDTSVSNVHMDKYLRFLVCSYVEAYPKIKWCPAPGCEYAIEFDDVEGGYEPETDYDVICGCSNGFCWNCTENSHRPVECNTVAKWVTKGKAESENMTWMLAYTKPCPKCKRSIEKNDGCMHMTCGTHCKFEFCWLCLKPWEGHEEEYYHCNRYQEEKLEGKLNEEDRMRENAKNSSVKYLHYYERWAANERSRKKAIEDLHIMENENLDKLCAMVSEGMGELKFVTEAWVQIVECRRVLAWTYAYGYYIPEENTGKKAFFEYLQGEAEASLERLHHCAETELVGYLNDGVFFEYLQGEAEANLDRLHHCAETELEVHLNVGTSEDGVSEVKDLNTDKLGTSENSVSEVKDLNTDKLSTSEDGVSDLKSLNTDKLGTSDYGVSKVKDLNTDKLSMSEDGVSKVKDLNTNKLSFGEFKKKLNTLSVASQTFFTNLVNALEDGLSEVTSS